MQDSKHCQECGWPFRENGLNVCGFTCLLARYGFVFSKRGWLGLLAFSLIIGANLASYFFKQYDFYFLRFEIILGVITYLFLSWPFFKLFAHIRLIVSHFYGLLWLVSLADFLIGIGWGLYAMMHEEILMRPLFVTGIFLILVVNYFAPKEYELRRGIHFEPKFKLDLRPEKARLIVRTLESFVAVADLKVGDQVKVMPGEVIPCDGLIISGTTSVNETIIFGENSVRLRTKGDYVIGASMNRDGVILVEVTTPITENFIAKKISIFKSALESKPVLFTKKSHYILVLMPWILVGVLKYQFFTQVPSIHLIESFVISLSLFGVVGLQRIFFLPALWEAIQKGILIPSLKQIQRLSVLDTLFFDRTGTLTKGEYLFSQVLIERGTNQGVFLSTIFSLENNLGHPLAKGVKTHPWYLEIPVNEVADISFQPGLGVSGKVIDRAQGERMAAVGNLRLMKRLRFQTTKALREKVEELEAMGETVLLCGWDGSVRGLFSLADTLRPDIKSLLLRLTQLNVAPVMITGDHDEMISHLQVTHGLKTVFTRCLPSEKVSKIHKKSGPLTVVGIVGTLHDGKEVIEAGDVGILLGTMDTLHAGSISIFGKGLNKITELISLARIHGARWSLCQKISLVSIMAAGFISMVPFSHPILVGGAVTFAWNLILKNIHGIPPKALSLPTNQALPRLNQAS